MKKIFKRDAQIHLGDTDATGVLYFPRQFEIATQTFELYLKKNNFSLGELVGKNNFSIPVVHAEADFFSPLFLGDEIRISLTVLKMGEKSFTTHFEFSSPILKTIVGSVTLVHVAVSKESKQSIPIPEKLLGILKELLPS
ncbi:MAG: acyl-CoA thioesterase [Anaerolineae bacterium]